MRRIVFYVFSVFCIVMIRLINKIFTRKRILYHVRQVIYLILSVLFINCFWNWYLKKNTTLVMERDGIAFYVSNLYTPEERDSADMANVISEVLSLLKNKNISYSDWKTNVFFFYDEDEYNRKSFYLRGDTYGKCMAPLGFVMLKSAYFDTNIMEIGDTIYNTRKVSETLSHELAHIYEYKKLGLFKDFFCSAFERWKIEGFSDYVANNSTLKTEVGLHSFIEEILVKENVISRSITDFFGDVDFYFKSRMKVDYLLSYKKIPEDEFWDTYYDVYELECEIQNEIKNGNYIIK